MLQNMLNHYSAYEFDTFKLKLVLVAHGAGLKFFLNDLSGTPWANEKIDPDLYRRFLGLAQYGVEAYLCQITYKRLKIDPAKTKTDAALKFVPSGVATVAELQTKVSAISRSGDPPASSPAGDQLLALRKSSRVPRSYARSAMKRNVARNCAGGR
jgi:intracellular sulfur oxidation DsrE/DsrF family protein